MDSDIIADLKQFISAELSQQLNAQLGEFRGELRQEMGEMKGELRQEIRDSEKRLIGRIDDTRGEILDALGDTMHIRDEAVDEQISDHETRIAKLEQRTA